MPSRLRLIGFSLSLLILGGLIGWFSHQLTSPPLSENSEAHRQLSNFKYISPLLECGSAPFNSPSLHKLNSILESAINKLKSSPDLNEISLYFRDLNNGASLGFNEDKKFAPASLLKVPVLIATLKLVETEPEILSTSIPYNDEYHKDENLPEASDQSLVSGQSYLLPTLLEKMIAFSDNVSKDVIKQYLVNHNPNLLNQVYRDFGLGSNFTSNASDADSITVKDYAGFFRILFNASYLNLQMSEYALSLLAKSTFDQGLTTFLPDSIPVANKFGFREIPGEPSQLHDCGIVYLPSHPYLLCIMTRGTNLKTMSSVLSQLSLIVYNELSTASSSVSPLTPSSDNLDLELPPAVNIPPSSPSSPKQ